MTEKLSRRYSGHSIGDFVVELPGWHQEVFQVVQTPAEQTGHLTVRLADERREMITGRKYDHLGSASPSRFGQIAADKRATRK
jgi:hypothetical protein